MNISDNYTKRRDNVPRLARQISKFGYYHITMRGVGRQFIFYSSADRLFFLKRTEEFSKETDVKIIAYCLMDNHVHLLLGGEMSDISLFAQKLQDSYSWFFNKNHDRVGSVFQGRFGSKPIESERGLLCTVRYIHKNPEKAGICMASEYIWSSYDEYIKRQYMCDIEEVLHLTAGVSGFVEFMSGDDSGDEHYSVQYNNHLLDAEAVKIAEKVYSDNLWKIKSMPKQERDAVLVELYTEGLSIRQVEMVTGIGRGAIGKAVAGVKRKKRYI